MDELFARHLGKPWRPRAHAMTFRLVLEPLVASVLAIRAGLEERAGPYFWAIFSRCGRPAVN